ncbi:unnamed protein product [Absidia cylindrospora]
MTKKAALLKPYLDLTTPPSSTVNLDHSTTPPPLVTRTYRPTEGEFYHQEPQTEPTSLDMEDEEHQPSNEETEFDLGPEPLLLTMWTF